MNTFWYTNYPEDNRKTDQFFQWHQEKDMCSMEWYQSVEKISEFTLHNLGVIQKEFSRLLQSVEDKEIKDSIKRQWKRSLEQEMQNYYQSIKECHIDVDERVVEIFSKFFQEVIEMSSNS